MAKSRFNKAVALLSGGLDSTVTLYYALKEGFSPTALLFDYNQRHKKELRFALKTLNYLKVPFYKVKFSFPWGGSALTDRKIKVPLSFSKGIPSTYVPGRNIIFLSFAVSLAERLNCKSIFIGAHTQDYSGYPDCRPEFINSFQSAVNKGIKYRGIKIVAPLINMDKTEIIKLGVSLGARFDYTWSCYNDGKYPCGKCDSCRYRAAGFKRAGIKDPGARQKN